MSLCESAEMSSGSETVSSQVILLLQLVLIADLFLAWTNTQIKTMNHHLQSGTCCWVTHAHPTRGFFATCQTHLSSGSARAAVNILLEITVNLCP